jgi:lysozyme
MPEDLNYSEGLAEFVRQKEIFRPQPYLDLKTEGTPTIGYGHVLSKPYDPAMQWTKEQAEQQLRRDLDTAVGGVRRQVSVPITQSQLDALTSLVFNVGEGNYKGSQSQAKLHAGDYTGAATEMLTFDNVTMGGKKVPLKSLTDRRRLEAEMFAGPYKHLLPPDRPKTK